MINEKLITKKSKCQSHSVYAVVVYTFGLESRCETVDDRNIIKDTRIYPRIASDWWEDKQFVEELVEELKNKYKEQFELEDRDIIKNVEYGIIGEDRVINLNYLVNGLTYLGLAIQKNTCWVERKKD